MAFDGLRDDHSVFLSLFVRAIVAVCTDAQAQSEHIRIGQNLSAHPQTHTKDKQAQKQQHLEKSTNTTRRQRTPTVLKTTDCAEDWKSIVTHAKK